jgi:hypothetical protein
MNYIQFKTQDKNTITVKLNDIYLYCNTDGDHFLGNKHTHELWKVTEITYQGVYQLIIKNNILHMV